MMRGGLLVAAVVILLCPAASATQPIVPVVTITLSPSSVDVSSPADQVVIVDFNGTVTVDKLPGVRIVVTLESSVDAGWPCAMSPTTMVFTSESPKSFTGNVSVPAGTPNISAVLSVSGKGVGGGFQSQTATATAKIIVRGSAPANKTGNTGGTSKTGTDQTNGGGTQTTQGGTSKIGSFDMTTVLVLGVVVAVAAASGAYWIRRRKITRRQIAETGEAPVDDVEAL
jgi:hypothetical protein